MTADIYICVCVCMYICIQKCKDQDVQNRTFAWVWNLVSHIDGGTEVEGVREQGTEEDIWA